MRKPVFHSSEWALSKLDDSKWCVCSWWQDCNELWNTFETFLHLTNYAKYADPLFKSCHLPSYCVTTNTRKARGRLSLHLRDPQQMQIMAHSGNWDSEINIEDSMTDWPILKARGLFVRCITFKQRHSFVFITSCALYVMILLLLNHLELYGSTKSSLEGCLVVLG